RLDAARADAGEHGPLCARGPAVASRRVEPRGLGQSLVARALARRRGATRGRRRRGGRRMTSGASHMSQRTIAGWGGKVRSRVPWSGSGPALVFLHGPWGLTWDPFLDELAKSFTVHAPEHPGTTPATPDDIYHLDGLWDLVLCYDELLPALGVEKATLVGH